MTTNKRTNSLMKMSTNTSNKTMDYVNINSTASSFINNNNTELELDLESNLEKEAIIYIKKAKSLLQPKCCLCNICSSKNKKYEEACNLYKKAGDKYKSINQWRNAGRCYENSAFIKQKIFKNPIKYYEESYNCYEKIEIGDESKYIFDKINSILEKEKNYFKIGKNYENLAIKEENKQKWVISIEHYLKAIKYFGKDDKHENAKIDIYIKLTKLMVFHSYPHADEKVPLMLENIAKYYSKNITSKYLSNEYYGKAILTRLYFNNNNQETNEYLIIYEKRDKLFEESNIYILCNDIIDSIEKQDIDKLNSSIQKYKEKNELDDYMKFIIDKIVEREKQKKLLKIEEKNENNDENIINNDISKIDTDLENKNDNVEKNNKDIDKNENDKY